MESQKSYILIKCYHMHDACNCVACGTRLSHGVVYFRLELTNNRQSKPTSSGLRKSRPSLPQPQAPEKAPRSRQPLLYIDMYIYIVLCLVETKVSNTFSTRLICQSYRSTPCYSCWLGSTLVDTTAQFLYTSQFVVDNVELC